MQSLKKMLKAKKAQFYVLTAILLIAYALLTLQSTAEPEDASKTFKSVYENYMFESAAVLNNALYEEMSSREIAEEYESFIDNFISYAKMKKLSIEMVSVLEIRDRVYIQNKLSRELELLNLNVTLPAGETDYFLRSNISEVVLEVKDDVFHENIYKFTIANQGTDPKAVLKVKKGDKREIFVQE